MDITISEEKIIVLESPLSEESIREKALTKRGDAFGQLVKFMQRPKPDEIEISETQRRLEPFWYGSARAVYKYDRRHRYEVPVAPEVQRVTIYEQGHEVEKKVFHLEALEHCEEELTRELMLEPQHGNERDYHRYLGFAGREVESLDAARDGETMVVLPEVRSSFLVGKLSEWLLI
jgi:hypothetical protein